MFFSVIIPVYNVEKYLRDCINSVLTQTFSDYEIILVDDGSSDGSPAICDEYAKEYTNIIVIHKKNGGSSDARNAGVLAASGEYICFLDSDDYWGEKDAFAEYWSLLSKDYPDILRTGNIKNISADGTKVLRDKKVLLSKYIGMTNQQVMYELVGSGSLTVSACSLIIARNFFIQHNLFFKRGIKCEDIEWALRLYQYNPTWTFCDRNVYVSRRGRPGSNTSTMDYGHLDDYMTIIEDGCNQIDNMQDKVLKNALISYLMYHQLILIGLVGCTSLNHKQKSQLNTRSKTICQLYMRRYREDPKVKKLSLVYDLFGYRALTVILTYYLKHRGR